MKILHLSIVMLLVPVLFLLKGGQDASIASHLKGHCPISEAQANLNVDVSKKGTRRAMPTYLGRPWAAPSCKLYSINLMKIF